MSGVAVNLSDTDLFDAITGSGAYSFPWYRQVDEVGELCHRVHINCEGVHAVALVTPDAIRAAIAGCRESYRGTEAGLSGIDLSDPECDSDFDAITADCVVQWLALGSVVFG